jgi:hypothetical protein
MSIPSKSTEQAPRKIVKLCLCVRHDQAAGTQPKAMVHHTGSRAASATASSDARAPKTAPDFVRI